jgi:hypothetical protein
VLRLPRKRAQVVVLERDGEAVERIPVLHRPGAVLCLQERNIVSYRRD